MPQSVNRVLVLGAGNFGTALAHHLSTKGHQTTLYARRSEVADSINATSRNSAYQSEFALHHKLKSTSQLDQLDQIDADLIVVAIPTQKIRTFLKSCPAELFKQADIVCAAKGIESESLKLPTEIIQDSLSYDIKPRLSVLSGPSFAIEILAGYPTAVSLASHNQKTAERVQASFHTDFFRVYTSTDPVGLEIAGALKNVMAIATGAAEGMGYKQNSKAALLTRSLAEMTRIGVALEAEALTFNGLGGVGDLFLTCSSTKSRNFSIGKSLGEGLTLEAALGQLGSTAEGVTTTEAAYCLVEKLSIDAPIIRAVYNVLYRGQKIKEAVEGILGRAMKPEIT